MKDTRSNIIYNLLLGVAIAALLILVTKFWVEHSTWGHRAESFTFELLQGQLSPFNPAEELPVVVVDVSGIPLTGGEYKDREKLSELINAIAEEEPAAIGVDIILSPTKKGQWRTQDDPDLLDRGLEITDKGVPVFFGVDSEMRLGNPSAWLGEAKFSKLAATIAIYREDGKRIPLWARDLEHSDKLDSMSFALAKVARKVQPKKVPGPRLPEWLIDTVDGFPGRIESNNEIEYADALINYSKLEALRQTSLLTISPASVKEFGERFRGRIVLLGNGTNLKDDNFIVPGRNGPVPGVFLHASAAYTLMHEPMYELKPLIRVFLDVMLSASLMFWIAFRRWKNIGSANHFDWHKLQRKLVWLGGGFVAIGAILLVNFGSVLWLDFIFIVIALFIHPWVERNFVAGWERFKGGRKATQD